MGDGPENHGIAQFSAELSVEWAFPRREDISILDCYALNVGPDETVTGCTYGGFPVFAIAEGHVRLFGQAPIGGPKAVLAMANHAALVGGYAAEYDRVTPLALGADGITAGDDRRNRDARRLGGKGAALVRPRRAAVRARRAWTAVRDGPGPTLCGRQSAA